MKKSMFSAAIVSGLCIILFAVLYKLLFLEAFETLMIIAVTIFYHFAIRLAVGYLIDNILHNRVNYNRWWFRESSFERKLYKAIKVSKWKSKMPTFDENAFDFSAHSADELLGTMCQAEIVHEVIILLSFVPLLFSLWWGVFPVFLITSLAAAMIDCSFVIMQRYNRPRVKRLLNKRVGR